MHTASQYLDRVTGLPPAPAIANELLDLFNDPNQDIERVVELIRLDPSLTVQILNRCNSAHFSTGSPAVDLVEVVMRLGFADVYNVVVALVTASTFSRVKTTGGPDMNQLWRHSVMTAVAAGTIASRIGEAEAAAFTAGLLHDIGKLIFAAVEETRYAALTQQKGACGFALTNAEQMVFGIGHASLGAQLLTRWQLPENIVGAVRQHHDRASSVETGGRLPAILHLANVLAHFQDQDNPHLCDMSACNPRTMNRLGMSADAIPELIQQIETRLQRVQGLFRLTFDPVN